MVAVVLLRCCRASVLNSFYDAISLVTRETVEKSTLFGSLSHVRPPNPPPPPLPSPRPTHRSAPPCPSHPTRLGRFLPRMLPPSTRCSIPNVTSSPTTRPSILSRRDYLCKLRLVVHCTGVGGIRSVGGCDTNRGGTNHHGIRPRPSDICGRRQRRARGCVDTGRRGLSGNSSLTFVSPCVLLLGGVLLLLLPVTAWLPTPSCILGRCC